MNNRLKTVGEYGLGIIVIVGIFLLIGVMLRGMVWASEKGLPWLYAAARIALDVCFFVLLPLCAFRKSRPWAGVGFFISSYFFGAMLFAYSCIVVVQIWGYFGLVIGLLFAGIGVLPVGLLATLFHGEWGLFWNLVLGAVLTFGTRMLGMFLAEPRAT